MQIKKGIPVSPGVAIFPAVVIDAQDIKVPRRVVRREELPRQHARMADALALARMEIEQLIAQVSRDLGPEPAKIFSFHLGMLKDPSLTTQITQTIESETVNAEYAVSSVMKKLAERFLRQDNVVFRERVSDIWDLEKRLLKHLIQEVRAEIDHLDHEAIIIAHDLTPSQTASIPRNRIKGLATDIGGKTSHTSIVARALGIPAVVGLDDATTYVSNGETVIIDGNRGLLIIDPDPDQLAEYQKYSQRLQAFETTLKGLQDLPARTLDGVDVNLLANIEFPEEIPAALARGAVGVGLYRTEFMFLSTETEPDEEQQFRSVMKALELMGNRPMTIRTIDLGADKFTQKHFAAHERNPFLGCRSIRFCLQNLSLFKTHLRAILRASAFGKLRLMFPLITTVMELRQARMILNDVMEDLNEQDIAFDPTIKVGMMIEVPSAALMAQTFTSEVDFFSIGTNDLIQYTLAVDRGNEHVANLYSGANPAVIKLIKDVIRAADRSKIHVSCCGEMAGELEYVIMLLGMGLRNFSMTPPAIPEVKQLIRSVRISDCQKVARRVASYDSERQIINYLKEETRKIIPEAFDGRTIA